MDTKSHKIAGVGVLVALAMVLSYLESLIPISLGIPGIKLRSEERRVGKEYRSRWSPYH